MAITYLVSTIANVNSGGVTDLTTPQIDTSGSNFICGGAGGGGVSSGVGASPVTDNKSNTLVDRTFYNFGLTGIKIWYAVNPTVGSAHEVLISSGAGSYPALSFAGFSGVDTSAPYDVENGSVVGGTTTIQPGSVTPSQDDSLIITCLTLEAAQSGTPTIDSGFTVIEFVNAVGGYGHAIAYVVQGGSSAVNPTWTTDTTGVLFASIAVFKPSGSPPPTSQPIRLRQSGIPDLSGVRFQGRTW